MLKHKIQVYFGIQSLDFHFIGQLATLKYTIDDQFTTTFYKRKNRFG